MIGKCELIVARMSAKLAVAYPTPSPPLPPPSSTTTATMNKKHNERCLLEASNSITSLNWIFPSASVQLIKIIEFISTVFILYSARQKRL